MYFSEPAVANSVIITYIRIFFDKVMQILVEMSYKSLLYFKQFIFIL